MANRDSAAVDGKPGKDIGERPVISELTVMHQQHDCHGGKLLAEGGKPEIGAGIDFLEGVKIRDPVAAGENGMAVLTDQHRRARGLGVDESRENAVNSRV